MEILLLLSVVLLSFIAYKLNKLEKASSLDKARIVSSSSSTLNALFSEIEIAAQHGLAEKWQQKVDHFFDLLQRAEKKEIEEHQKSGREKSEFKPSDHLKGIIQKLTIALNGREATQAKARRMIEANIAILNGKTIAEVSEQFYGEKETSPLSNTNLCDVEEKFISAVYGEKIKKEYDQGLLGRNEYWQGSWDRILERTE